MRHYQQAARFSIDLATAIISANPQGGKVADWALVIFEKVATPLVYQHQSYVDEMAKANRKDNFPKLQTETSQVKPATNPAKPPIAPLRPDESKDFGDKFLQTLAWDTPSRQRDPKNVYSWVYRDDAAQAAKANGSVLKEWFETFERNLRKNPSAGIKVGECLYTLTGEGLMFLGRTKPKPTRIVEATPQ